MLTNIVTRPTPWDHDLNRLESKLPEDASIQVKASLATWFLRRRFKNIFIFKILSKKFNPPLWSRPYPGEHEFNKLDNTLPKDASTKVTAFLAN